MPTPAPLRPIARRALAAQSDERLVKLVREGHEPAFEEMVRRYRGPLVAFASAIVSADGAEDVVQASLEKANRALLADSREITLRPWLFAIVRNGALNAIRGEPRVDELQEAMATSAGPSEIAEQREDLDRLVVAMCALPDAQRQALVKRELEGVGHGEIAAQLGTTATAVRGLIFRARTGLRDVAGAVVPLPIVRTLLMEAPAPAIGLAGGGAGMGAAAMLGGGAAKGGTAIAAAVIALGTGIAIDHGRKDSGDREGNPAATVRSVVSGPEVARASNSNGGGSAPSAGAEGSGGGGGSSSSGPSAGGSSGGRSGGPGSGDDIGVSADDSDGNSSGGSGSSGSSGNSGQGGGGAEVEEAEDESSGSGSSGHGGGGSGGGSNSGSGGSGHDDDELEVEEVDPVEIEEVDEVDENGVDSSGSGKSGSGSSGSGSGTSTTTTPDDLLDEEPSQGTDGGPSGSGGDEPDPPAY